jgi:hypothetical protein
MTCRHRAVLVVTRSVEGTSTNIARERKNLSCGLETGHGGRHRDLQFEEEWQDGGKVLSHILRHEDE